MNDASQPRAKSPFLTREFMLTKLLEMLFICIGILLAFGVDKWSEKRAQQRLARKAVLNCKREIGENLESLKKFLPFHEEMRDSLMEVMKSGKTESLSMAAEVVALIIPENGIEIPKLRSTAWETAIATQAINYMAYDKVSLLSNVYTDSFSEYAYKSTRATEVFYDHRSFNPGAVNETLNLWLILSRDLVEAEHRLIKTLSEAHDRLKP